MADERTMTTAQAGKRTHCPNCGMKLPEQPLSLCAYCAFPLDLTEASDGDSKESPNAARIARISEHDKFAEAMEWNPPESPAYWKARVAGLNGKLALGIGAALLVAVLVTSESIGAGFGRAPAIFGIGMMVAGLVMMIRSVTGRKEAVSAPLLRRPAMIIDRRSETAIGQFTGTTTYYFTIEFEDSITGEFTYPGRGSQEDPYTTNLPGVAYTRGAQLLSFKHIRV